MELTPDYHERSSLFGIKTLFQFLGYAAAPALGLGLAAAYGDDLVALYGVQSVVLGALGMIAYVVRRFAPSIYTLYSQALFTFCIHTLSSHPLFHIHHSFFTPAVQATPLALFLSPPCRDHNTHPRAQRPLSPHNPL
jgi:Na+/melibiose symporter-like transporter